MSSTYPHPNKKSSIDQMSWTQLVKTKKSKQSKKIMIHQSGSLMSPDDFVLFPEDVVKEKHSSIREARPRRSTAAKGSKGSSSPMTRQHLIEHKAPTPSRRNAQIRSELPVCLIHMSTVNCTVDCAIADAQLLAQSEIPPTAPSPPRLPTPEVSDFEEDDLWSCCDSSWSSMSKESSRCDRKAESVWDDMGASSTS